MAGGTGWTGGPLSPTPRQPSRGPPIDPVVSSAALFCFSPFQLRNSGGLMDVVSQPASHNRPMTATATLRLTPTLIHAPPGAEYQLQAGGCRHDPVPSLG